jgi:hypothetical protein
LSNDGESTSSSSSSTYSDKRRANSDSLALDDGNKLFVGTIEPALFGVNGKYHAKLLLLRHVHAYADDKFGADVSCEDDAECRNHFFKTLGSMKEFKRKPPEEFDCDRPRVRTRAIAVQCDRADACVARDSVSASTGAPISTRCAAC